MESVDEKKIEDILLEAGLIDKDKLEKVKSIQQKTGEKLEKVLLSEGINYKEIQQTMARKMGVEYADLELVSVNTAAVQKVSPEVAKKYLVFPFDVKDNLLHLAMQNPDDIFLIDEIKMFTQMEIKPFLSDSRLINKAISYFYADTLQERAVFSENRTSGTPVQKDYNSRNSLGRNGDIEVKRGSGITVDEFMQNWIMKSLKTENIAGIYIDAENRNINVTFNIKY